MSLPMKKKCCCLTPGCRLGEDDFNRSNSSPPTGKWRVVSGTWQILDNELTGSGILATTICHPISYINGSYVTRMKLVGMSDGSDNHWEVGIGKPDAPSYVVEISHNSMTLSATLNLWSGNKAVLLYSQTYFGVAVDQTLTICYAPGLAITASIGFIPAIEWCDSSIGDNCYIISGNPVGGFSFRDGTFDDWVYEVHWLDNPICEKCPCFCEKSREDFSCYPQILYLSFISVGSDEAVLNTIPLYQAFLDPSSYLWPEKVTWFSAVQSCGSPIGAQWTARFECAQQDLGHLAFGTSDYNFVDGIGSQVVFSWLSGSNIGSIAARFALKELSTCDPLELEFPQVKVNSAFPSPSCIDPPCDTTGCYTPYCTDRNLECFVYDPDIRFVPKITV